MHALKTLYFAGVVLDARGRWSCAHRQLPIRPQINRHGRPPEEGSTTAGGAELAHVLCGHDGELRRYLHLGERGERRRRTARSCFVCRLVVKNLDLHAVRSGRVCGRVR